MGGWGGVSEVSSRPEGGARVYLRFVRHRDRRMLVSKIWVSSQRKASRNLEISFFTYMARLEGTLTSWTPAGACKVEEARSCTQPPPGRHRGTQEHITASRRLHCRGLGLLHVWAAKVKSKPAQCWSTAVGLHTLAQQ